MCLILKSHNFDFIFCGILDAAPGSFCDFPSGYRMEKLQKTAVKKLADMERLWKTAIKKPVFLIKRVLGGISPPNKCVCITNAYLAIPKECRTKARKKP